MKRRPPSALEWLFADAEPPYVCPGDVPDERLIMAGCDRFQLAVDRLPCGPMGTVAPVRYSWIRLTNVPSKYPPKNAVRSGYFFGYFSQFLS